MLTCISMLMVCNRTGQLKPGVQVASSAAPRMDLFGGFTAANVGSNWWRKTNKQANREERYTSIFIWWYSYPGQMVWNYLKSEAKLGDSVLLWPGCSSVDCDHVGSLHLSFPTSCIICLYKLRQFRLQPSEWNYFSLLMMVSSDIYSSVEVSF